MTFIAASITVFLAATGVAPSPTPCPRPTPAERAKALRSLAQCNHRPYGPLCSEDIAATIIGWRECGEPGLTDPLLDAAIASDGALSETLGSSLLDSLVRDPRPLIARVSVRSVAQQRKIGLLVLSSDGSGIDSSTRKRVVDSLSQFAGRVDASAATAKLWLELLREASSQ